MARYAIRKILYSFTGCQQGVGRSQVRNIKAGQCVKSCQKLFA